MNLKIIVNILKQKIQVLKYIHATPSSHNLCLSPFTLFSLYSSFALNVLNISHIFIKPFYTWLQNPLSYWIFQLVFFFFNSNGLKC